MHIKLHIVKWLAKVYDQMFKCLPVRFKWKTSANGSWYWLILKVLKVFDFCMKWWYWKFLVMVVIDITFLGRPLRIMFCKVSWFYMASLKSIKTLMGGCINSSYWIQCDFVNVIFWTQPIIPLEFLFLDIKFLWL